jgi:5-methyltetrahydrofolate--homocysteine methyltransferase
MDLLQAIADNVIKGRADANIAIGGAAKGDPGVKELVQKALDQKVNPAEILNKGLIAGMDVVGKRFKANEVYIPEVLISARAMKAGMAMIRPLLTEKGVKATGSFIVGTVKGDLHDIGKNLVAMMMEGAGFNVIDLGVDVTADKFVASARENPGAAVGMSALLTTTMTSIKDVIATLKESGLKNKTMIGGAPVTQNYADEVGASGYAPDAASAVDKAKQLLGIR